MKKLFPFALFFLSACATNMQYGTDGVSNKNWLEIAMSKKDFGGKKYDICYKFNLRGLNEDLKRRINNDDNCITKCCWLSERGEVVINTNKGLEEELRAAGRANKYSPAEVKIKVSFASVLGLANAAASPNVINRNGVIKLKSAPVEDRARLRQVEAERAYEEQQAALRLAEYQQYQAQLKAADEALSFELTAENNKKLAVSYVRRFYGRQIDSFLYSLDEAERKRGNIILFENRQWQAVPRGENLFTVSCYAPARFGKTQKSLKNTTLECGVWLVSLEEMDAKPHDALAIKIAAD